MNSPSLLSRDRIQRIQRWAREGLSAAEMQRRSRAVSSGAGIATMLKYATPVWEEMAAAGNFCGCGERRGHKGLCIATWESAGRIRGPQPIPVVEQVRIINALLNGDSILSIRMAVGVSERKVLRIFRAMSAKERHGRAVLVRRRIGDADGRQHGEDLFERILAVLPRGIDEALRDDVVGELCLAVLEGDLTIEQIAARAGTFVDKAYRTWANAFGPRSLNETIGEDGDAELLDLFGDITADITIDELIIGEHDA